MLNKPPLPQRNFRSLPHARGHGRNHYSITCTIIIIIIHIQNAFKSQTSYNLSLIISTFNSEILNIYYILMLLITEMCLHVVGHYKWIVIIITERQSATFIKIFPLTDSLKYWNCVVYYIYIYLIFTLISVT